ncbi:NifU family protein [Planotetraspora mira]|uniref:Thioredoxin n=1 Tax=Planotetraspora mira TaxID=58121 RepID=A0A8J3TVE7_9ACTN|nr:NifU family protein [Planotetraspora mira]GII32806.1 thioredoxin [Planotetraspora mira]
MPEASDHNTRAGAAFDGPMADVHEAGARVEALIAELAELGPHGTRSKAEELVRVLVGLYGEALERVMRTVTGAEAAEVLHRLTTDDLVSGLLIVHDLHPLGTADRVLGALEEVRPHLGLHDGGVELVGVDPSGVVRLRLEGTCHGCPSSRLTVTGAIERAITRAAPEVTRVDVEGLDHDDGIDGRAGRHDHHHGTASEPSNGHGAGRPLLQIQRRPPGPCPVPEEIS